MKTKTLEQRLLSHAVCIIAFCCIASFLPAQSYLGVGLHLTPPIHLDYTQNTAVAARPRPGLGGSITYKKEWAARKGRKWYMETGLTLQGFRFYQVSYTGDSINIWTDFPVQHTGYPAVLLGGGHSFRLGKTRGELAVGLETSFVVTQTLFEIYSYNLSLSHHPIDDATFPLYLRLNLAYNRNLRLFNTVPGQLQIYTNLSAQKFTKGSQFIRDKYTGIDQEGKYAVNNSELGIKFFAGLNKKALKPPSGGGVQQGRITPEPERRTKYRISLTAQLYAPHKTVYYIPQVDSFSVKGRAGVFTPQFGITLERPFKQNPQWSAVLGVGMGYRVATMAFRSDGRFPADRQPLNVEQDFSIGGYGMVSLGLSRSGRPGRLVFSHTLSATAVLPFGREAVYMGVSQASYQPQSPPYEQWVLDGSIDYKWGREPVLFGGEYNPEVIFNHHGAYFVAVGLVANYSYGVMAQGKFKVANEQTTYYGALLQKFSKVGVTVRVGLAR